ncbi:MAG: heterodisulfide reductase subunit B [Kiritimatiellaeota bacterium]|nr:heterodisulfide reductase subunit B [Kiritimatiellota bacterium]
MKFGYYPGCSLEGSGAEYAHSAEAVLAALGVELEEVDDWVCCGATPAHATSHLLPVALSAIACAAAEKQGLETILTCCAACFSRLKQGNHDMQNDPALLAQINEIVEEDYHGGVAILHLAEVLVRRIGLQAIQRRVRKPLTGLKVACYYGCLLTRMPEPLRIDSLEYPTLMDDLMRAAGAEPVDWPFKTECCGAALTLARGETVVRLSGSVVEMAKDCGADILAVACPLCQANLDMYQSDSESKLGRQLGIPVLYFTQLLAVAFDLAADAQCLNKGIVDPLPVLADRGLIETGVYL